MYNQQVKWLIKKSYQWLEKASLKDSTEALVMAVQVQPLRTRSAETGVYHKDAPETVHHIVAGFKMQAGKTYTERHN